MTVDSTHAEAHAPRRRPRLRGVSHEYAFYASLPAGLALVATAPAGVVRAAAVAYAVAAAAMFGVSALYHRVTWPPHWRRRLCRVDHATIYLMIAGSYTPLGLLVLQGAVRTVVLSVVWTGALAGAAVKAVWFSAPKWTAAALALAVGATGLAVVPQLADVGGTGLALLLGGGAFYAAGALVYGIRWPDPRPSVFGYHEVFHALVVVAVAAQYAGVAFFVLR